MSENVEFAEKDQNTDLLTITHDVQDFIQTSPEDAKIKLDLDDDVAFTALHGEPKDVKQIFISRGLFFFQIR